MNLPPIDLENASHEELVNAFKMLIQLVLLESDRVTALQKRVLELELKVIE